MSFNWQPRLSRSTNNFVGYPKFIIIGEVIMPEPKRHMEYGLEARRRNIEKENAGDCPPKEKGIHDKRNLQKT